METLLSMSLLTMIALLGAGALRTTWQAWDIQDSRSDMLQQLSGVLSHITRHLRESRDIVAVSNPSDTSGYLSLTLPDKSVVKWAHDNTYHRVLYGLGSANQLLATGIDQLKFECFELDGVTPTTVPADIRMVRTTVTVTIPVQAAPFSLSSTVWIRKQRDALAAKYVDFDAADATGANGFNNASYVRGPPDGLLGVAPQDSKVKAKGFDTNGYSGSIGTVLVGLDLRTDGSLGSDALEVQIRDRFPGDGPKHRYTQRAMIRFQNSLDWFWVDVTGDYATWTYADIANTTVRVKNKDVGSGGTRIRIDSIKIRTFESAPQTETTWMSSLGIGISEWRNAWRALGPSDGNYARSTIFTLSSSDVDRQSYVYTETWRDLGTIIGVRLAVDFYVNAKIQNDRFHGLLAVNTEPGENGMTPPPARAVEVPKDVLNQHVGIDNRGTAYLDFTNYDNWTWPVVRSYFVRLYMSATDVPEAEIYVDDVALEVRYVPPTAAAVVLWEEL